MPKLLVTTDTSKLGLTALDHARALAKALNAQLTILTVQADPSPGIAGEFGYIPPLTPEEAIEQEKQLRADLEGIADGSPIRIERASGRSVPTAILDAARDEQADMLVMSTHGRSGLSRVLLGSVAEAVVHQSPIPVLLIRGEHGPAHWG